MKRAAALLLVGPLLAAGTAAATGAELPVIMDCTSLAAAPSKLTIACGDGNFGLTGMHWRTWGKAAATGIGEVSANDCNPYCAAGHFHTYAVVATADRLETCLGGRRQYSRLSLRYTGSTPASVRSTSTVSLGCDLYARVGPQLTARRAGAAVVLKGSAWQRGAACARDVQLSSAGKTIFDVAVDKAYGFTLNWKAPPGQQVVVARQECQSAALGSRLFEAAVRA